MNFKIARDDQGGRTGNMAGELVGIQYLRGIAAMMVVLYHLPVQLRHMGYSGAWLPGLSSGVDIFFVISGFIMWITTAKEPVRAVDFWRRRLIRIAPLYWAITGFITVMMLVAPTVLQTSRLGLWHVVASFLFVAARHPGTHTIEPVIIPGWTLNYEIFFYLIFGIFLAVRPSWRFWGIVATLFILVIGGSVAGTLPMTVAGFYTSDVMLEFAFGMAIGVVALRPGGLASIPASAGSLMAIAGLAGAIFPPDLSDVSRLLARGLPSAILVLGIVVIESHRRMPNIPTLHRLGNASYSIYLSHAITLSATSQLWRRAHLHIFPGAALIYALSAIAMSMLVGWLLFRFVERPLIRRFGKARQRGSLMA